MEAEAVEIRYLEDYLDQTGWGLYYKFLLSIACACNFARGVTFVTMVYAVALSNCQFVFVPEQNAVRIYAFHLTGCGVGGLIGNSLSDRYGRKKYHSYSLMCMFFSSFVAAFAYNAYIVVGAAFLLGVGLGTNAVQTRLLVAEVLSKTNRGAWLAFCEFFWALGYILTTLFVILFESPTFLDRNESQRTTWRIMFATSGGINLLIACACALIEESPRFYLTIGRNYLAFLLLKQLYAINNSSYADNYKVKENDIKGLIKSYNLAYTEPEGYWATVKGFAHRFWKSLKLLFSKRFCQTTWVLILIKIPVFVMGIYQLNILLAKARVPSQIKRLEGLDFIYPILRPLGQEFNQSASMCSQNENNEVFYTYVLLLASAIVPGQILSVLFVDWLGRIPILCACLVLSSGSFLVQALVANRIVQIAASCIIVASVGAVLSVMQIINVELYPTAIRSTSAAVTTFPGYLIAVIFISLITIEQHHLSIILGILYFGLSIFSCFLPESKGIPMVE